MTAQPEHPASSQVAAIPHTINAIGDALRGADRARTHRAPCPGFGLEF
ncbi:hypothetical protein ACFVWZ_18505 [Streptomyces sp. NPDC058200]